MMRPKSISELIDVLDKKRSLYTARSIRCLRAFIDGWMFASDLTPEAMQPLARFESSLQERYGLTNLSWDRILLLYASDDFDAYEKFFQEFKQFSQTAPGSTTGEEMSAGDSI